MLPFINQRNSYDSSLLVIAQVFAFNRQFHASLDAAQLNLLTMADCFVRDDDGFTVYENYCMLYPKCVHGNGTHNFTAICTVDYEGTVINNFPLLTTTNTNT